MAAYGAQQTSWYGYGSAAPQIAEPRSTTQTGPVGVLTGADRDARARKSASASFANAFRIALLVGACFFVLGLARVGMCAAAVTTLEANNSLKQEVSAVQDTNRQLKIEVNSLSNNSRIANLATQKFNMVYVGAGETLKVDLPHK